MEKSKNVFGRPNSEVRRNSADKATAFHRSLLREKALPQNASRPNPLRPLRNQRRKNSVNLGNLWLKIDQSKIINYAKRTQFRTKSSFYNHNFNNELQRKNEIGHLVKTNPNEPNLWSGFH